MENGRFYPEKHESFYGRVEVVVTFVDDPQRKKIPEELEEIRQRRLEFMGCMEGKIRIGDDFDDPIEGMEENTCKM